MRTIAAALLFLGIITANGQADSCLEATPFVYFHCEDFADPYPQVVTLCYQFITTGDSVDFSFGYFAFCSDLTVTYTLYNALCDSITSAPSGSFDIAPGVLYIVCGTVECLTPGGIREVCTTELANLPVELIGMSAYPTDAGVTVSWATASEHRSAAFEVFRMTTEGDRGKLLASLVAAGYASERTDYRWTDTHPEAGMRFYRLEGVDMDGARRVLMIVPVTWKGGKGSSLGPFDLLGRRVRPE